MHLLVSHVRKSEPLCHTSGYALGFAPWVVWARLTPRPPEVEHPLGWRYENALAGGSDHMIGHDKDKAVNPYNPFLSMWIEIARKTDRGDVLEPQERITRAEALKTHTIWGAYLQFSEKSKGSIEPGKLADLVVLDRDYLTCPEDQIKDIQPLMTILEGKIVYEKP